MFRRLSRWKSLQLLRLEDRVVPAITVGLTTTNQLLYFDTATPGTILRTTPITGLQLGEDLLGLDVRPANGKLYAVSSTSQLYTIDFATGAATAVGAGGAFVPDGTNFGVDFNPTVDRLRVVSDADQNLRVNPNDGTLAATDLSLTYAAGDSHVGTDPNIVGSAYSNNRPGIGTTTLYGIDSNLNTLVTQNPPNNGTLNTVGGLGVDTSGLVGFDILTDGTVNTAYASLTVGGSSNLYTIDLTSGAATEVGTIGLGTPIRDIAVLSPGKMLYAVSNGTTLVGYLSTAAQVPINPLPITGLQAGETILGIDFRPANGLLYGLGSSSRLYQINTTTAVATQVGTAGQFTLTGTSFGFDFNPVADRIRVVSNTGQNLRLNPDDGTVASFDPAVAYALGDQNFGATPSVVGLAYTNDFAGATSTTLYGIDSNLDVLVTQNPTTGVLTTVGPLGVNTQNVVSFDIAGDGTAFAVFSDLESGPRLYTIDLTTGTATLVSPIGIAVFPIGALAVAPSGQFQFSSTQYTVGESDGTATITINRINGSSGPATVDFTISDGSATAPGDYINASQTVLFIDGQTSATVTVPITNDQVPEPTESAPLMLTNPTAGATLAQTQTTADLTIFDDDPITPGQFQFSDPTYQVSEAGVVAVITVLRINGSSGPASVDVTASDGTATSPDDYTAGTQTAVFSDGQMSTTVEIPITNDMIPETDETVNLALSNAYGGSLAQTQTNALLTIIDDDAAPAPGSFQFSDPVYSVAESGIIATITINRIGGSSGAATVDFTAANGSATSPSDFTAGTQTVQFADGQIQAFVTVPITNDQIPEQTESVNLSLSNPVGAGLADSQTTAVLSIFDDDIVRSGIVLEAVGSGLGDQAIVNVYQGNGEFVTSFDAYPGFHVGAQVAVGDMNNDGVPDVITGAGLGGGPHVKVWDGAQLLQGHAVVIREFYAYSQTFFGGVYVAVGDVTGDGQLDIITGAGVGGGPHVKVFDGNGVSGEVRSFYAYSEDFHGGVSVAAGYVDNDNHADIVTGAVAQVAADDFQVKVFNGDGVSGVIRQFNAYSDNLLTGLYVAVGHITDEERVNIITGAGTIGGPHVKIFDIDSDNVLKDLYAYDSAFPGGARVASADLNGDGIDDLMTGAGVTGGPHVRLFDVSSSGGSVDTSEIHGFYAFDADYLGGVFVAAGRSFGQVTTGPQT
jgi:hypothetical protein